MPKSFVSESRTGFSASETSSRLVQASSTYSQKPVARRGSSGTLSRPSTPSATATTFPESDLGAFGSAQDYLLELASPGLDALYNDDNQDRINLKHALEDLSQQASQPQSPHANGHHRRVNSNGTANLNGKSHGQSNGHGSSKRPRVDAPNGTSPSKGTHTPASPRRNGAKDANGRSNAGSKSRTKS